MATAYFNMGAYQYLRRMMNTEFKRVGITKPKDKYGYFLEVLGSAPLLNALSLSEMERVITSLTALKDHHYSHLTGEIKKEKKAPNDFSIYVKKQKEKLGWTNREFSNLTGLSGYRLSRIATGTLDANTEEEEIIRKAFIKATAYVKGFNSDLQKDHDSRTGE